MKTYPKYKDSNIPWIGKIPCEWNVTRNKNFFTCKKEIVGCNSSVTQLLSLTKKGVVKKDINNTDGKQPESFDTYQYVNKDDIVMCLFDLDCSAVFSGISNFNGMISPAYKVLKCKNIVPRFVDYWFSYVSDGRKFNHYAKNIRYTLNFEDFSALPILIPTIREQQSIAAYLDRKCSAIDSVIKTESRIIEKLKEYRQSLITEAVSHGLNPHAPMKASGIPWIGRIPRHWGITQISRLFNVILGKMLSPKPLSEADTLENYLCSANIRFEGIDTKEIKQMYFNSKEKEEYLLKKGDVLISEGGDAGSVSIYNNEAYPCYIQNAVHKLFSKDDKKALNRFLYYWIFFCKKIGYIDFLCNKVSIMHYTKEKVLKTPIVVPPIEEQTAIADFLDKKCSAIDSTISKKQQIIEKMTEYKKSLIYECVTGKLSI